MTPPTLESLAKLLRTGPVESLAALYSRAEALANHPAADGRELRENLEALLSLMQHSTIGFHDFTAQLQIFVNQVVDESAEERAARH